MEDKKMKVILEMSLAEAKKFFESQAPALPPAEETEEVKDFLEACVIDAPGQRVKASDLFERYVSWFRETNRAGDPMTQKRFGRAVGEKYTRTKTHGGKMYYLGANFQPNWAN
jgi:hypothetical protein